MRTITLGVVCVTFPLLGCRGDGVGNGRSGGTSDADPWSRPAPIEFLLDGNRTDLTPDQYARVVHNEGEALAKLEASPWVKVSPGEAKAYTGKSFDGPGEGLVLLRALALNEANGAFYVTWRAGEVHVHHGCLGRRAMPETRRAVIARLPALPAELYVDCHMAE